MKRLPVIAPFALLALLSIASHWIDGSRVLGNLWAAAFLACILCVPVLSRTKLWLGYAALVYPFGILGLHLSLDLGSLSIGWN